MNRLLLLGLGLGLFTGACQDNKKEKFDLIISNATIVDIGSGELMPEQLIGISGDTIRRIDDQGNSVDYEADEHLDAENNYIMPGLWDMHVHFRGGDTLVAENKGLLPLFLAHGITTVRDAGGDMTPAVMDWRDKINKGELDGPKILTSGPKLDGPEPTWEGSLRVRNQEDIMAALDSLESIGVDYVKMYDGSLSKETFYGIIREAEKRGLKTTGHMPLSADLLEAIELGLDGTEHLYYVLKASSPKADSLTRLGMGYGMMDEIISTYDPELAGTVFSEMEARDVFVTPTLHIGKTLAEVLDVDHQQDSLLQFVGSGIQQTYQGRVESAKRARKSGSQMRDKMGDLTMDMIVPMYEAGVNIIAGSDCGAFNSYVYPGGSLHGELERLVTAGLSPQQAMQTSIMKGPEFFGLEDYYGSINHGKVAHLLLLESNPLEDIGNLQDIKAVIKTGQVYDRNELDKMLEEAVEE